MPVPRRKPAGIGPPLGQQQQVNSDRDEGEAPVDVTPGRLDDKTLVGARMRDAVHDRDGRTRTRAGFSEPALPPVAAALRPLCEFS